MYIIMKKLTILFSILIASISAYAASTLQITLSSASQGDKVLQIIVDDQFSDAYDNGYDATIGANQAGGLYICSGNERYSLWATNALAENLPMGFGAVADNSYTLEFSYFTGATFTIYDAVANKTITVASSSNIQIDDVDASPANKYTFEIDNADKNSAINDRFFFNYNPYVASVTTNAEGLATFSFDQALAPVEAGVKLYKGAVSGDALNLTQVADIAAAQGVIVYGEANKTYHFTAINGATADFSGNELKAASTWAYPHAGTAYVLSGSSLYVYEGENMKPNKAFLLLDANSGNGAPRRVRLVFDQATGVENVATENVKAEKFIENGQVLIKRGEVVYNLQGQIVK